MKTEKGNWVRSRVRPSNWPSSAPHCKGKKNAGEPFTPNVELEDTGESREEKLT